MTVPGGLSDEALSISIVLLHRMAGLISNQSEYLALLTFFTGFFFIYCIFFGCNDIKVSVDDGIEIK